MAAFWLGLAMYSAYRIARGLGATRLHSVVGSTAWISTPIVWAHAGYSMVSLGISLLPFYFLAAMKLFLIESPTTHFTPKTVAIYFAATILSVFIDRTSVVSGKSVSVRVDLGGRRIIKKQRTTHQ